MDQEPDTTLRQAAGCRGDRVADIERRLLHRLSLNLRAAGEADDSCRPRAHQAAAVRAEHERVNLLRQGIAKGGSKKRSPKARAGRWLRRGWTWIGRHAPCGLHPASIYSGRVYHRAGRSWVANVPRLPGISRGERLSADLAGWDDAQ